MDMNEEPKLTIPTVEEFTTMMEAKRSKQRNALKNLKKLLENDEIDEESYGQFSELVTYLNNMTVGEIANSNLKIVYAIRDLFSLLSE